MTFEALCLVAQFGFSIVALFTLIVTAVILLNKKKQPPQTIDGITSFCYS